MLKGLIAEHYPASFLSIGVMCLTETSSSKVLSVLVPQQHPDERRQKCQPALFILLAVGESVCSISTGMRKQKDSGPNRCDLDCKSDLASRQNGSNDAFHTFILAMLN